MTPKNKLLTDEDLNLCIEYYLKGYSSNRINQEILNSKFKSGKSILDALKKVGIYEKRDNSFYNLTKNHNYLNCISTEEQAYFLGLLQADGWCIEREDRQNGIGLSISDKNIVKKFKEELQTDCKIVTINKDGYKPLYQIQVVSAPLYSKAKEYCVSNKFNGQYIPACINDKLLSHYIRGLFDGDGCFCVSNGYPHLVFNGGVQCMSQLSYILTKKLLVTQKHPKMCVDTDKLCNIRFSNREDLLILYQFLYNDCSLYIESKKDKFYEWYKNNK